MQHSREETIAMLDALEKALPGMVKSDPDAPDFWPLFAGEADVIVDGAAPEDCDYVRGRIDCMLKNAGMIPGEDEGEPCR
jgi:hypothetical protein